MNNEIPYSRKIEGRMKKIYYKKVSGQYFPNTLSIGEKDEFDNFEIVCSMYQTSIVLYYGICQINIILFHFS